MLCITVSLVYLFYYCCCYYFKYHFVMKISQCKVIVLKTGLFFWFVVKFTHKPTTAKQDESTKKNKKTWVIGQIYAYKLIFCTKSHSAHAWFPKLSFFGDLLITPHLTWAFLILARSQVYSSPWWWVGVGGGWPLTGRVAGRGSVVWGLQHAHWIQRHLSCILRRQGDKGWTC